MDAFLVFNAFVAMAYGDWTEHDSPSLPREDGGMGIAYYDDSIYVLYVFYGIFHQNRFTFYEMT